MLSHANIYLHDQASFSLKTSNRYSSVISKFYTFLGTQNKFKSIDVSQYHVVADNRDIRRWQVDRQIQRAKKQSLKPSTKTIFEDAKNLANFFIWLVQSGYPTNVDIKTKAWQSNFKHSGLLNYISRKSREALDFKDIKALDKDSRQSSRQDLITGEEIFWLKEAYNDPIYGALFDFSLGTAMRPMDLCNFPFMGTGDNTHIQPYSNMAKGVDVYNYLVTQSKNGKSRVITINKKDLEKLENDYIKPYYYARKKLYKKKYGADCPPSILFLNKSGTPISPEMISSRTNAAKIKAKIKHPKFRDNVTFYDARHWWPTIFLIRFYDKKLLTSSADALYLAVSEVICNQMGHEDISTTFKHYVDMARLVMMAHEGKVNEIVNQSTDHLQFINSYTKSIPK
jgi:integrase